VSRKKFWTIILSLLGSSPAFADTLTFPYDFTAGTTIQSAQVNANFTEAENIVNGNLTNANIKASASISLSKLNLTEEFFILRGAGNRGVSHGVTADTVPRVSLYTGSGGLGGISFGAGGASAQDLLLRRTDANTLALRNFGDSADKNLTLGDLTASGNVAVTGNITVGSITSGTWAGTIITTAKGGTGTDLSGGAAGDLIYMTGGSGFSRLAASGNGSKFIRFNAGANAPEAVALVPVTAGGTGTDLSAAAAGSVAYFTSGSAMGLLNASGNASKFIRFNSGANAIEAATPGGSVAGDGSDGAVTLTTSTVSGPKQYNATTLSVTAANTVTHDTVGVKYIYNATGTITINGTITGTGVGYPGGTGAPAGSLSGRGGAGPGGGGAIHSQSAAVGGGGGGSFGAGGRGGAASGTTFGCAGGAALSFGEIGGSGGGGGQADGTSGAGGAPGAGGAKLLFIAADTISLPSGGVVNALGGAATNASASNGGGGGGGGGGDVWFISTKSSGGVNLAAGSTVNVTGGAGSNDNGTGGGGGGGGGGRVRGWCAGGATMAGTLTVAGGAAGTGDQNGEAGGTGSSASITGTPNYPLIAWAVDTKEGYAALDNMCMLATIAHGEHIVEVGQRDLAWAAAGNNLEGFCYYNSADTVITQSEGKAATVCGELEEIFKDAA